MTRRGPCRRGPRFARPVEAVAVVVPAHDEEALLPACLASVRAALDRSALDRPHRLLVVVADACTDRTEELARRAGALVVRTGGRNVGAARRLGAGRAVQELRRRGVPPDRLWLASTDADSTVPTGWISHQLALLDRHPGAPVDAVLGTVAVTDWTGHPPALPAEFHRRYRWNGAEHPHVHGANLGVRADAYRRAGGFPAVPVGEDRLLAAALEAAGHRVVRDAGSPVVTSSRTTARAPAGFAADLRSARPRDTAC